MDDATGAPAFTPQLIGQTEKALNAFLERELAGTGLTEPQWVTLRLATIEGGAIDRSRFVGRLAGAVKVEERQAQALIDGVAAAGFFDASVAESRVEVTGAGRRLHDRIRTATGEIAKRLWADLPAADLASAARVLGTVLERANAELATA